MTWGAIYIVSDDGPHPAQFDPALALGHLSIIRQVDLTAADIRGAWGLIATAALDQVDFAQRRPVLEEFLARGGRIVFNGHLLRPFADGLQPYIPLPSQRRADLELERLAPHPVFAGIPVAVQQTQRGIAGFYGRGHNPPPAGAQALTGIGPERRPVDWEWLLPPNGQGGRGGLFVHAGNDIWGTTDDPLVDALVAERLVAWSLAGQAQGKAA
jgi:hypothetical protein